MASHTRIRWGWLAWALVCTVYACASHEDAAVDSTSCDRAKHKLTAECAVSWASNYDPATCDATAECSASCVLNASCEEIAATGPRPYLDCVLACAGTDSGADAEGGTDTDGSS
jgi:hypothetical protein